MRLYYSPTSPYARKVRILMIERGLTADLISASFKTAETAAKNPNPLGKVPALETDDGQLLFDSRTICAYIDTCGDYPQFIPVDNSQRRWDILRAESLADGLLDAAVGNVFERIREDGMISQYWMERREEQMHKALALTNELAPFAEVSIGFADIVLGVSLDYINLRHAHLNWSQTYPDLYRRHQKILRRDSFKQTAPPK